MVTPSCAYVAFVGGYFSIYGNDNRRYGVSRGPLLPVIVVSSASGPGPRPAGVVARLYPWEGL